MWEIIFIVMLIFYIVLIKNLIEFIISMNLVKFVLVFLFGNKMNLMIINWSIKFSFKINKTQFIIYSFISYEKLIYQLAKFLLAFDFIEYIFTFNDLLNIMIIWFCKVNIVVWLIDNNIVLMMRINLYWLIGIKKW